MDQFEMEALLRNLDRRVGRIEQFLPTLATKTELQEAVTRLATKAELQEAVAPLATRAELQEAIAPLATKEELRQAMAPLATKAELQDAKAELHAAIAAAIAPLATKAEVRAEAVETRRHFDVVAEGLRSDIRLLADAVRASNTKIDRLRVELKEDITGLDRRVTRLEGRAKRR